MRSVQAQGRTCTLRIEPLDEVFAGLDRSGNVPGQSSGVDAARAQAARALTAGAGSSVHQAHGGFVVGVADSRRKVVELLDLRRGGTRFGRPGQ
ncbi:hypothetical protein [Micromonospora sp. NPDC023888]|uniref:hypothetical protein n=1 Tax=Micromonospora sp. NPDC023888 TaxID=3155607 RepID=UPI0033FCF968